jgi:dTDP-4-dehydrorhamnose reductase
MTVRAITTAEFGARAMRPAYSVLNCGKLQSQIGRQLPQWQDAVQRYLAARPR